MTEQPRSQTSDKGWTAPAMGSLRSTDARPLQHIFTSLKEYLKGFVTAVPPTGSMNMYAGTTAPMGWLICDGSAVSRTEYAELFGILGSTYGAGNGTTTFNLPDMRGRTPIGAGQGSGLTNRALAATGGAETHTLTSAQIPAHSHTITDSAGAHTHNIPGRNVGQVTHGHALTGALMGGSGTSGNTSFTFTSMTSDGAHNHTVNQNTGGGGAHNNMQPFIALNYIIKA